MIFRRLKKPDPKVEQELFDEIERHGGLEDKDVLAMIISGLLMILPVGAIALMVIIAFMFLFF